MTCGFIKSAVLNNFLCIDFIICVRIVVVNCILCVHRWDELRIDSIFLCLYRWGELQEIANKKKETLQLAHDVNTWHIECQETMVSIINIYITYLWLSKFGWVSVFLKPS